jgi:hypothetical protein
MRLGNDLLYQLIHEETMKQLILKKLFILAAILSCPVIANGDLILDFSADGSVSQFTVDAGQTIEVPIYLRQLSVMSVDLTTDALTDFGLNGALMGGDSTITGVRANGVFEVDFSEVLNDGSNAELAASTFGSGQTGEAILLGSFTIMGISEGTTMLNLTDSNPAPTAQDFLTASFANNFDADVFAPSAAVAIRVSAVPEPSSLLMLGCLGLTFVQRRRKA